MNAIQSKNLLAASRIFARKSSQVHGSRPLQLSPQGKYLPPKQAPAPFNHSITIPVLKPYEKPIFEQWATNIHTGNPHLPHKDPWNPRDLHIGYRPYETS